MHVRKTDVSSLAALGPVLDPIVRRRSSLFGHVARLREDTPVHLVTPPADVWRRAATRGHSGLTLQSSTTRPI